VKLGFIGGGKMAEAMIAALVGGRVAGPRDVFVGDVSPSRRRALKSRYGVNVSALNSAVVDSAGIVMLAVKPQDLEAALRPLSDRIGRRHLVISIAAGKNLSFLEGLLPGARVVRVMPNLACQVAEGMSVFCPGAGVGKRDIATTLRILRSFGLAVRLPESLFDAVTALSGSGPAFLASALDGMIAGAVEQGLSEKDALMLARQTMLGTAKVLADRAIGPAELVAAVASPGGTTAAGLAVLNGAGLREIMARTIAAAAIRSRELSR
jgi:pyrroline-5-carboxylate reductase